MAKQDDYVRYTIRVPREPYAAIEKAAEAANRSVNAEVVARIEASVHAESSDYQALLKRSAALENELRDARAMNYLLGRSVGQSDNEIHKHLVISKAFCLAIMRLSENVSAEIFHFAQQMFEVYDAEFDAMEESKRIELLRKIADVPEDELAAFDADAYLRRQLGTKDQL